MHIVPLERANLADVARVGDKAYATIPFMSDWLRPNPTSFPDHGRQFWARRLKGFMHKSHVRAQIMVADSNDGDDENHDGLGRVGHKDSDKDNDNGNDSNDKDKGVTAAAEGMGVPDGTVLGFAIWIRAFSDAEKEERQRLRGKGGDDTGGGRWPERESLADRFERWAVDRQNWYHGAVRTDRSYDLARLARFQKLMGAIRTQLFAMLREHSPSSSSSSSPSPGKSDGSAAGGGGGGGGGYIYLGELGVDPACQGRGIAKRLLRQGMRWADEERVPLGLFASSIGAPVYAKAGFKVVGQDWMSGGPDHDVMVYWPPGMEPANLKRFKVGPDGEVSDLD